MNVARTPARANLRKRNFHLRLRQAVMFGVWCKLDIRDFRDELA